jgi:uncharacterized protein YjiS (DUF1127 family)
MNYAATPIAADFGIREPLMSNLRRAAAALWAAIDRANRRKCHRRMLENEDLLRDLGLTREQVRQAFAECS